MTFEEFKLKAEVTLIECAPNYYQEFVDSETFDDIAQLFFDLDIWDEDDIEEYSLMLEE